MRVFHVTSPEAARAILQDGFSPESGDAGLGIYFYDRFEDAVASGRLSGRFIVKHGKSYRHFAVIEAVVPDDRLERLEGSMFWVDVQAGVFPWARRMVVPKPSRHLAPGDELWERRRHALR